MQEVKISLQIGEITHEIGEKNNTAHCSPIISGTISDIHPKVLLKRQRRPNMAVDRNAPTARQFY